MEIKACTFDIFGTCVDWRGSVEKVLLAEFEKKGLTEQSGKIPEIAQAWRDGYSKYNQRVASGAIASEDVQTIDFVHRQILSDMVKQYSLQSVWTEAELDDLNLVWHRLQPWPDTVEGIKALKQICIVSSLSNGNIRLQVDQAKFSNLQWDVLISSELFKSAKPNPKVYLGACKLLNLKPEQICMVAAHKADLEAAKQCGLKTAYIARNEEEADQHDPKALPYIDFVIETIEELAKMI